MRARQKFGMHVDNAVRLKRGGVERPRSDLSATLFLCEAGSYEGGELTVKTPTARMPSSSRPAISFSTLRRACIT